MLLTLIPASSGIGSPTITPFDQPRSTRFGRPFPRCWLRHLTPTFTRCLLRQFPIDYDPLLIDHLIYWWYSVGGDLLHWRYPIWCCLSYHIWRWHYAVTIDLQASLTCWLLISLGWCWPPICLFYCHLRRPRRRWNCWGRWPVVVIAPFTVDFWYSHLHLVDIFPLPPSQVFTLVMAPLSYPVASPHCYIWCIVIVDVVVVVPICWCCLIWCLRLFPCRGVPVVVERTLHLPHTFGDLHLMIFGIWKIYHIPLLMFAQVTAIWPRYSPCRYCDLPHLLHFVWLPTTADAWLLRLASINLPRLPHLFIWRRPDCDPWFTPCVLVPTFILRYFPVFGQYFTTFVALFTIFGRMVRLYLIIYRDLPHDICLAPSTWPAVAPLCALCKKKKKKKKILNNINNDINEILILIILLILIIILIIY